MISRFWKWFDARFVDCPFCGERLGNGAPAHYYDQGWKCRAPLDPRKTVA